VSFDQCGVTEPIDVVNIGRRKIRTGTIGAEPGGSTPEAFGAFVRGEIEKWGKVVREAGVKVE